MGHSAENVSLFVAENDDLEVENASENEETGARHTTTPAANVRYRQRSARHTNQKEPFHERFPL